MLGAALVNSLAGFGIALLAMPLLIGPIGLKTAAPLIGLVGIILRLLSVYLEGVSIDFRQIRWMVLGGLMAVPIGVAMIDRVDERFLKLLLGIILVGYVTYRLLKRTEFRPIPNRFGFIFGFLGGLFGGAFNTSGPPVIIYSDSQQWRPEVFKVHLQTYFLCNATIGIFSHYAAGNYTNEVFYYVAYAIPVLIGGTFLGRWLNRFVGPQVFKATVLTLLVVLGVRLILTAY